MSRDINEKDKVLIRFSVQADKKGYTGKTDYAIGTVKEKVIVNHVMDGSRAPEYSTNYLIHFDEEYFLEQSDLEKSRFIFPEHCKYITSLTYCQETSVELGDDYLKPKAIYRI